MYGSRKTPMIIQPLTPKGEKQFSTTVNLLRKNNSINIQYPVIIISNRKMITA